jgi:hypothetical protein
MDDLIDQKKAQETIAGPGEVVSEVEDIVELDNWGARRELQDEKEDAAWSAMLGEDTEDIEAPEDVADETEAETTPDSVLAARLQQLEDSNRQLQERLNQSAQPMHQPTYQPPPPEPAPIPNLVIPELSEDDLQDPDKVRGAMYALAQSVEQRVAQAVTPALHTVQSLQNQNMATTQAAAAAVEKEARRAYEAQGFDDWDELRGEIAAAVSGGDPASPYLLNEQSWDQAALLVRRGRNLPLEAKKKPRASASPPRESRSLPGRGGSRSQVSRSASRFASQIERQFGVKLDDSARQRIDQAGRG